MLKKFVLALMPLTLVASANADDLDLDLSSIQDADVSIVEGDLDIDVDGLSADAGEEAGDDHIRSVLPSIRIWSSRLRWIRIPSLGWLLQHVLQLLPSAVQLPNDHILPASMPNRADSNLQLLLGLPLRHSA